MSYWQRVKARALEKAAAVRNAAAAGQKSALQSASENVLHVKEAAKVGHLQRRNTVSSAWLSAAHAEHMWSELAAQPDNNGLLQSLGCLSICVCTRSYVGVWL